MRAVRYERYGGPEVLQLRDDVPEPHAGPGRVRVAVVASGVNGIDAKIREGLFASRPLTRPAGTGVDAAGVVDEVGEGVEGVAVGDAVLGSGRWTAAESAVLSSWAPLPEGLRMREAAGWPVPVETSVRILGLLDVPPGGTLVVSGAGGGVGTALVQLAVARGLRVVGTASAGSLDRLGALGAAVTTYEEGWPDRVRGMTADGVAAAVDVAGAGVLPELIALTDDPARVVSIADGSASVLGVRFTSDGGDTAEALAEASALHARGAFALPVERALPLADAAEAQRLSRAGHAAGRTVLVVRPD